MMPSCLAILVESERVKVQTVPKFLSPSLIDFCNTFSIESPTFIRSIPPSWAKPSFCFDNVARKVSKYGGVAAYGWAIWHVPGVYFEAEHHCVWRNSAGIFIDVSPQMNRARKILFLPGPDAIYDPEAPRATILVAESNEPMTVEFVDLANERNVLLTRYHAGGPKRVTMAPIDQFRLDQITNRLKALTEILL
jgi:hypothetical protein